MRRNFRTRLRKLFDVKNDYESLEKAVNFSITDQYVDKFSNMCVIPDHVLENKAMYTYKEIAKKAKKKKPEDVIKYLDE